MKTLDEIKKSIATDDQALIGALMKLYQYQTMDEKYQRITVHQNDVGFNGADSKFLSSVAEQYKSKAYLTDRQIAAARKAMIKYSKQLLEVGGFNPLPNDANNRPKRTEKKKMKTASLKDNHIEVNFSYDIDLLSKIKTIPGRKFNNISPSNKFWSVPFRLDTVDKLIDWGFEFDDNLMKRFEEESVKKPTKNIDAIPGLKKELYPFQKQGVQFIEDHQGRALVGDEMGLGKTIQALAWLQLHPEARPALIVCPASLKLNWAKEIENWMGDDVKVTIAKGKEPDWNDACENELKNHILIINYDILTGWADSIKDMKLKAVVLDECHYVKNSQAKRTKTAKKLFKNIKHIICLSGTPILNRPIEIFNSISLVDSSLFPSFFQFAKRYCGAKHNGFGWDFNGATNTKELNEILTNSVMIRRLKKDVLPELPEKVRSVIPMELDNIKTYRKAENDFIDWLRKIDPKKAKSAMNAETLVKIETLKQLCIQGKIKSCIEWIKDFLDTGEKLVVFCTHKKTVEALKNQFQEQSVVVDGSVKNELRQKAVDDFQNDDSIKLFIGNIKAAGVGITLTAASNTCFIEMGWTPGEHDQAEDRVHRIGQEANSINAWYLVSDNTIETEIATLIDQKRNVLSNVLDGVDTDQDSTLNELLSKYKNKD